MSQDKPAGEVLVQAEHASKIFCRDLKKSLFYGVQDIACEFLGIKRASDPFAPPAEDGSDLRKKEFWASRDISFELRRGECLGLIGHNGAGKTTLLKMLNGLIKPDRGRIMMKGRVGALIALGAGFNPILTGRENIYVNGSVLGLSKSEIDAKFDDIVDFSGIPEFIDSPVQNYSSGMQVRLGFAIASSLSPDILLIDEVLAVGDFAFRNKCLKRIKEYLQEGGSAIFVSHNMAQVQSICTSCLYLDHGQIKMAGDTVNCINAYNEDLLGANEKSGTKTTNPDIELTSKITGRDGGPLRCLEPAQLTIEIDAAKDLPTCYASLVIFNLEQSQRLATITSEASKQTYPLKHGRTVITAELDNFNFMAGRYAIRTNLMETESGTRIANKGAETTPDYFNVDLSDNALDCQHQSLGDLLKFEAQWK